MTASVRWAALGPALAVAVAMRKEDRDEVMAACGKDPVSAMTDALRVSTSAWVGFYDERPVCVFGVAPLNMIAGVGTPWLLGTDELAERPAAFLRRCRPYVGAMLRVYPKLVNHVDDRNEASKRWLGWLGFKMGDPAPYGVAGRLFRPFSIEVSHV